MRSRARWGNLFSPKWLFFLGLWCAQAQTASDLTRQGRYSEAAALFASELETLQAQALDGRVIAWTFNSLALIESKMGRFAEADGHFQRAIAIWERDNGATIQLAIGLSNLGGLRTKQGRYQEGVDLQRKALGLLQTSGVRPDQQAALWANLGDSLVNAGRYLDAEETLRRAVRLLEEHPDDNRLMTVFSNLAVLYRHQSRLDEAKVFAERALAIAERILSPDHPELAITLYTMAQVLAESGRLAEAEAMYTRAVGIMQKHGPDHPDLAAALSDLGVIAVRRERYPDAENFFQRALSIQERTLGTHPDVSITLNNLAACALMQGRPSRAASIYAKALAIARGAGEKNPLVAATLLHLAQCHYKLEYYSESHREARQALLMVEETAGPGDPTLLPMLELLSSVSAARGKRQQAEAYYRRGLSIAENQYGPEDSRVKDLKVRYAHMRCNRSGCNK